MRYTKGKWSLEEDNKCFQAVSDILGDIIFLRNFAFPPLFAWKEVAQKVGSRNSKQCRERYLNHLKPGINRGKWTAEEDKLLIQLVQHFSKSWKRITTFLPTRPENSLKMRWRVLERRNNKRKRAHNEVVTSQAKKKPHLEKEEKLDVFGTRAALELQLPTVGDYRYDNSRPNGEALKALEHENMNGITDTSPVNTDNLTENREWDWAKCEDNLFENASVEDIVNLSEELLHDDFINL